MQSAFAIGDFLRNAKNLFKTDFNLFMFNH
jgi:hypothetical protein